MCFRKLTCFFSVFLLVSVVVVTVCAEDIVSHVAAQMDIPDITALQAEFTQT